MGPHFDRGGCPRAQWIIDGIRTHRSRFDLDGDPGPKIDPASRRVVIGYLYHALGDVLLLTPVVAALLRTAIARPVGLLLLESGRRVFDHLDLPVRVHTAPESEAAVSEPGESEAAETEIAVSDADASSRTAVSPPSNGLSSISEAAYDISVDLTHSVERDARPVLQSIGAPFRLGWIDPGEPTESHGLTWGTVDTRVLCDRHWSRFLMLPLRSLGATDPHYVLPLRRDPRAEEQARRLFSTSPRLVCVPGTSQSARKGIDPALFIPACRHVVGRGGSVVVCGAPTEGPLLTSIREAVGNKAISFTGDLATLFALIEASDLVLTNDTGPMHAAFLLQKPTVAVFTRFSRTVWGPPTPNPRHITFEVDRDRIATMSAAFVDRLVDAMERVLTLPEPRGRPPV